MPTYTKFAVSPSGLLEMPPIVLPAVPATPSAPVTTYTRFRFIY